ncbi:hypothetical protein [Sinanaerobacter sp. ZZT-01]|uniref:hypothetical protein n=1 Tax=Sinanaerobacter sp. ZZT-01 TaxID=3111540 RepID=UPI002D78A482|nr:hypothetical protein [Sinanaerobacter sp. ZZT-01]WRR93487.1 hypothetical protein U5921_15875 [Sinanaerobacter sp. ZZT-01]
MMVEDIKVEICVCTECVMRGAMDLVESVESLKKLKRYFGFEGNINVEMSKCLGHKEDGHHSLVAAINGKVMENADSESVMEKVIGMIKKDVK